MLFNSFLFVFFFAAVLAVHARLPHRARNVMLLVASYGFYATWNWKFLALILLSTALDFVVGKRIAASTDPAMRKRWLLVSLTGNLSILCFFKYYGFFLDSFDLMLAPFGLDVTGLRLDLILPLGISFYTLQTMSYTIDVYRGHMEPVHDLADFALYVCFFPQLVAGPIERAPHLVPQIQQPRRISSTDIREGLVLAIWGLFKKVVIADNLATIVDPIYAIGANPSGLEVLLATYAFTIQVYADFSAYSDIARGTARMLGFHLILNFERPFFERDMAAFWRRWHMSLSNWLRDYLYIPLGGNRNHELRTTFNLWFTLFVAGVWHGSDGTFLAFGAYHGLLVVISRRFRQRFPVRPGSSPLLGMFVTLHFWVIGLVFFRAQTAEQSLSMLRSLFTNLFWQPGHEWMLAAIAIYAAPIIAFDLFFRRAGTDLFVLRWPLPARVIAYLAIGYTMVLFGRNDALEFVYFQF